MSDKRQLLGLGKVRKDVLERTVVKYLPMDESPGLDGGMIRLSGEALISHSPSIGVPLEALGFFAFHYAVSNVAERFGKPKHLITGIYLPTDSTEEELKIITQSLGEEARKYDVTIVAGQTATYVGLETPLITSTCIGEPKRKPLKPQPDDIVLIAGSVGGEALWINSISNEGGSDVWRGFTPLPVILSLQSVDGLKVMHDISEGGVKKALQEVASAYGNKLDIQSKKIPYADGIEDLKEDPLRAPTYGSLILVASPDCIEQVQKSCRELGVQCEIVGVVASGEGVLIDGEEIGDHDRMAIDWVYGSFETQDKIIVELRNSINQLLKIQGFNELIPRVGSNMVYAKPEVSSSDDVASIDGRMISSRNGPRLCGDIIYGGSKYTSSVIFEACRINPDIKAALSIRGGQDIVEALEGAGYNVKTLSPDVKGDTCPVALSLAETDELYTAYYHTGEFGIEPTVTLLGQNPEELVNITQSLVTALQR